MKALAFIILAAGLYLLVRRRLLHIDLSFFLLLALLLLSAASLSQGFILFAADIFGIVYEPLVVILIALFLILCLVILLSSYLTRLQQRHVGMVRRMMAMELAEQERALAAARGPDAPVSPDAPQ